MSLRMTVGIVKLCAVGVDHGSKLTKRRERRSVTSVPLLIEVVRHSGAVFIADEQSSGRLTGD
jgi:hypothetical protein